MSASYTGDLSLDRDRARFLLGDTDTATALLQDESIDAMLGLYDFNEAVAQMAMGLATQFAQEPDKLDQDGGLVQTWTERVAAWHALAKDMRSKAQTASPTTPRSGVSVGLIQSPDTSRLRS